MPFFRVEDDSVDVAYEDSRWRLLLIEEKKKRKCHNKERLPVELQTLSLPLSLSPISLSHVIMLNFNISLSLSLSSESGLRQSELGPSQSGPKVSLSQSESVV